LLSTSEDAPLGTRRIVTLGAGASYGHHDMTLKDERSRPAPSHHLGHSREGARQPEVFNAAGASLLEDTARFDYLPPDEIVSLLDAPAAGVVIDFGAGTGVFSIELARRRPDLRVIALDEQPRMLELMRAKPALQQFTNIEPMPVDRIDSIMGHADRILAINVLHEVGDDALREMSHLLKPKGAALIIDWDGGIDRSVGPPKGHTHTLDEARERLTKAGFQVETLEHMRYHFVLRCRPAAK
jgi:SAM-dependent methyltransferase